MVAMALWAQHLLVLTIVAACVAWSGWQGIQSLWGKRSRMGSCCSRGCAAAGVGAKKPGVERIVIVPVEALRRRK